MEIQGLIAQVLKSRGRNGTMIERNDSRIEEWKAWYKGYVEEFHKVEVDTGGGSTIQEIKYYLSMAKKVCENYADLLLNEKCDIVIPESGQELLNTILNNNHFWQKGNALVEIAFALGNGAIVEGVKDVIVDKETHQVISNDDASIFFSFVDYEKIFPITFENNHVSEVAFAVQDTDKVIVQFHLKDKNEFLFDEEGKPTETRNPNYGLYDICNYIFKCQDLKKTVLGEPEEYYTFHTGSEIPWFQIIKPNIVNNLDIDSPLGISIFANAISSLKAIDNTYDSLNNEIELGRKRILVSEDLMDVDPTTGEMVEQFNPRDKFFYRIKKTNSDDKDLYQEVNGELRIEAIERALNLQLSVLSNKVGLGNDYFKFNEAIGMATATAVISQKSDLFRSIKKHEIVIEEALRNMVKAIAYICNTFTKDKFGEIKDEDITIQFDDSIIEDKEAQKLSDRQDLATGVMSKVEYRMKWYGEDEETATKELAKFTTNGITDKITALVEPLKSKVITPTMFVDMVYGNMLDESQKKELIDYIAEGLKTDQGIDAGMIGNFGF